MDPPRALLLICAFHRLAGERAPLFSLHPAREHPRSHRPRGSLTFRLAPLPWPCGTAGAARAPPCPAPLRGGFLGENKLAPGDGQGVPGPRSSAGPGAAGCPREFVCKRKSPGERGRAGHCAACPPGGGCSPSPCFWPGSWGGEFRPCPAPHLCQSHPGNGGFSTGERPGIGGEAALQPGRAGRAAPGPGSPAGCGRLGQIYFWCGEVSFFPRRELVGGEEGGGDSCKTTCGDELGRGASPQLRSGPRPPRTPSPQQPAGTRPGAVVF